jgi:hypothetical protein
MNRLPYERWVQDALLDVAKRAMAAVAEAGSLFGGHHFYLTFATGMSGVEIPPEVRARYPDEMTVVLQHRFWDLEVTDEAFSVVLTFGGDPARIRVPWDALVRFQDPSVKFGVEFQPRRRPAPPALLRPVEAPEPAPAEEASNGEAHSEPPAEVDEPSGAEVLTLDRFRNK